MAERSEPGVAPDNPQPVTDELQRVMAELRAANERLIIAGVQLQELADQAQRAKKAAEEANQAKDEFLAVLSHELRTPMNAVLGWTYMLRHGLMTGKDADRALEVIERNAKLQAQLISDLLQVSQIVRGKLRLEVQVVDLAPLIDAGMDALRPAASAKGIQFEAHVASGVGHVLADPARVEQIIWNLLSNAIKFTPPHGRVEVDVAQSGETVSISFTDSGVGIAPEIVDHVFDRFRQADSSSHRPFGGLGLGLTIVRQLMELHGGTVKAESQGLGQGSTFTLTFPRCHADSTSQLQHPLVGSSLHGLRVLVVEDEPDSRDLLRAMLGASGADVTAVSTVREAMAHVDTHPSDLLVVDIGLPDEDGFALIREIRAREHGNVSSIPAMALTACARPEDRAKALAAGFQIHVAKPVNLEEFLKSVAVLSRLKA